ncbi:MAG: MerR family transcriptional regulator [Gammaproteobacteria bacterium]
MENMLTIGQLAKLTNTTPVAIRYYEREGLIPKSTRSKGGYRLYPKELVPRFYFIQNAKSVGFSLDEIKERCGRNPG